MPQPRRVLQGDPPQAAELEEDPEEHGPQPPPEAFPAGLLFPLEEEADQKKGPPDKEGQGQGERGPEEAIAWEEEIALLKGAHQHLLSTPRRARRPSAASPGREKGGQHGSRHGSPFTS